jgi:hypothetical protein
VRIERGGGGGEADLTVQEPFFATTQLVEGLTPSLARETVLLLQQNSEEGEAVCLWREVCHSQRMSGEELTARAKVAQLESRESKIGGEEDEQQSAHSDEHCPEDAVNVMRRRAKRRGEAGWGG